MSTGTPPKEPTAPSEAGPFWKVVALWIPRQFLTPSGADLERFVADANQKIVQRGFILWDGQILVTPLGATEAVDLFFEGDDPFGDPSRREWQSLQREYFGLENPYQMTEDGPDYTQSHIMTRVFEPYLSQDERIAAIVHGRKDSYYFYCRCHQADVVYTTRHRLVCMGCGAMHAVLRRPLPLRPKLLLTAVEWTDYFDEKGSRRDEEIELSIVDVRDVETAETIWTTDQWDEAMHRFVFFARSSPEAIEEAIRGTGADPTVLMEAGWTPVAMPLPPAHQVLEDSVDIDLLENAALSLRGGVSSYLSARERTEELVNAIPRLFTTVELLLKARLRALDPRALTDRPDNPAVLKRLGEAGVVLPKGEADTVNRLRRLRNDLQHGAARFNHRKGLSLCRKTIIALDRFAHTELGLWVGDVISHEDWYQLLSLPEIAATAETVVDARLASVRQEPESSISICPRCNRDALVRPHPATGASCIYCGNVPVDRDQQELEEPDS